MEISGSRILVAGATGILGERFARGLDDRGAALALCGRNAGKLDTHADDLGRPAIPFDYEDSASVAAAVDTSIEALGGLDAILIATGAVAFGLAGKVAPEVEANLMRINATGPMALISAALEELSPDGAVVAITAVVAEFPTAGMAAYSASKAALAAYLAALRRESRKDLATVLEVSPGHMETGFAERKLAGSPPPMPAGADAAVLIETTLDALAGDKREVRYDLRDRSLHVK